MSAPERARPRGAARRRRAAAATAFAVLLAGTAPAQEISDPDLFEKSQQAAEQATAYYGLLDRPEELARVNDLGYRIAAESGFTRFPFTFFLIDMPVPNAFALPGGQIFLTRGMLDMGLDDDMLAGLLGHEIGHVVEQHGIKLSKRATLLNILSQVALVGVLIAARNDHRDRNDPTRGRYPYPTPGDRAPVGDRVTGTAAAGVVVSELLLRSYSREFEDEADEEGQRMAAAAGFDPTGTQKLMALMRERLPEDPEAENFGYWRTHPFFEERVRAAEVRAALLKVQPPQAVDDYRKTTQEVLLAWREEHPRKPPEPPRQAPRDPRGRAAEAAPPEPEEERDLIKIAALAAWPRGERAEKLRLERLERRRDALAAEPELNRDYGELLALYRRELEEVRAIDPDSSLPEKLEREIFALDKARRDLYARAVEVFRGGVYQVEFLETFDSNFPDALERPEVALALGEAYSRLGRGAEAARQFLYAWREAPDSEAGIRAGRGLAALTPQIQRLDALQTLVDLAGESDLQRLAEKRLDEMASSYKDLANGAQFLKQHPDSPWADTVTRRLHALADNAYGEVVLYQTVGDHAKALDGIQRILTHAPMSPAAERLRSSAVLES